MDKKTEKFLSDKVKKICVMVDFQGREREVRKALKRAIKSGAVTIGLVLICLMSYADNLIIPTFGILPNAFKALMLERGYEVVFNACDTDNDTFAYVEYTGANYVLHTVKPVSKEDMVNLMSLFREKDV